MRYLVTAAAAALMSAGAAQAAVVDLTYTVEGQVAFTNFNNGGYEQLSYGGPSVGEIVQISLSLTVDTEQESFSYPGSFNELYSGFDADTGAILYFNQLNYDDYRTFDLFSDGTGRVDIYDTFAGLPPAYQQTVYDVLSWSVEGLPEEIPTTPLPATGILLLAGVGGIAWIKRRR